MSPYPTAPLLRRNRDTMAIPRTSVTLKVSTVTTGGYTRLTTLSTGTLPTGVTATFTPPTLGPNASGLLTLTTSGSTPSSSNIEVRGTATIEGAAVTRTGINLLNVQAPVPTFLAGQVLDETERPIPGVTIKLGGSTPTTLGTTDAAGNFLVSLSVGCQVSLIDGSLGREDSKRANLLHRASAWSPQNATGRPDGPARASHGFRNPPPYPSPCGPVTARSRSCSTTCRSIIACSSSLRLRNCMPMPTGRPRGVSVGLPR